MDQLGVSAIHPTAPEVLTAFALFTAPIDLEKATARLKELWNIEARGEWVGVDGEPATPGKDAIFHFSLQGVQVLLTPVSGGLDVEKGALPEHNFHVAMTFYAPLDAAPEGELAGESADAEQLPELKRRGRMVSANIVMTQLADALMREEAAIGVFRPELGAVHPAPMVTELAESLTQGEVPLPLWLSVRVAGEDLHRARTLGLPIFGHLDVEVADSPHTAEELFALVGGVANYIVTGGAFLLPGQTLGWSGADLALTQAQSAAGDPVIRIAY
ncbi:hypothetical protein J2S49_000898 [Arcanobacterium wilhelmae]|uniref:DUF4261 domain-containing protein n=1 Tax=Arcanobacterium wilhelmae TaxID=1803177 RepID=A0ABT9NAW7_9ACTO|nr:DUF4261 domain-containing protein [Arcanobacterium wilhelmae]MDP9800822.1 hypothetical protein [Arcanobacterium wilhelmae]WFN90198.1 DUF4261 domain-containing protein [Arcanobacterium wilhelmae]